MGVVARARARWWMVPVDAGHGLLMGFFPVNILHHLVHLAIGLWGIVAYRGFGAARLFARGLTII
jgi:hypothetical protein